jgi:DNA-binding NarL/FixJ family response regulator
MQIVLYSNDINLLTHWEKALKNRTQEIQVLEEIEALHRVKESVVIVNYESLDSKKIAEVLAYLKRNNNRILLLHRVPNINIAKKVLNQGVMGYGNALMRENFLSSAIETLEEGMIWLSPELTSELIIELPTSQAENQQNKLLSSLTKREKEVALLLKDGLTYNTIADTLGITNRTVKAHAHAIYKKLNVHDRIGFALLLK